MGPLLAPKVHSHFLGLWPGTSRPRRRGVCFTYREESTVDILTIALIVIAVLALSGWGYGTYVSRPTAAPGTVVEASPAWVNPPGVIGLIVVVGVIVMLATG